MNAGPGSLGSLGTATVDVKANLSQLDSGLKSASYKVQQFGQTLDDLQYVAQQGLRPVLNNLMQISPILGIGALAVDQFVQHSLGGWGKVKDRIGEVLGFTRSQADQMEELARKTAKTADETERLLNYERQRANLKAQEEGRPQSVAETEQEVNRAVIEGPQKDLVEALLKSGGVRALNGNFEVDAELKRLREDAEKTTRTEGHVNRAGDLVTTTVDRTEKEMQAAREAYREAQIKAAKLILADAAKGGRSLDALVKHMEANPGAFSPEAVQRFRDATPQGKAALEEESETERGNRLHLIDKQLRQWREAEKKKHDEETRRAEDEAEQTAQQMQREAKADAMKQRAEKLAKQKGISLEAAMEAVRDQDQQRIKAEMAKAGLVGSQTMGIDQLFRWLQEGDRGAPTKGDEKIVAEQKETTAAVKELNQTLRQRRFGAQFGR